MTGPTPSRAGFWHGVHVAMVTPFRADASLDRAEFVRHGRWLAERAVGSLIVGGSLGEGATLSTDERSSLVTELVAAVSPRTPVVAAVGALSTATAVEQARAAEAAGARGLLVLPPYVYRGDARETAAHFSAVLRATELPGMLYNNPPAYGTDVSPEEVLALASDHPNLTGVKESSGDVRRITALRELLGDRLELSVGVDDALLEGLRAGAVGWVAGLANALPDESLALFRAARAGAGAADELYRWFLPLLRLDDGPRFVHAIKLVTAERGFGHPRLRLPRLELAEAEREAIRTLWLERMADRPAAFGAGAPPGTSARDAP